MSWISAIIGAGASTMTNLSNAFSNDSANKANKKIAQMNNEFNERMLQKQMDYNTSMWNAQNAYNTPSEQRKRYEQAGINPYLALGNIASGQAGSAGGVTPPTASPATMQPTQFDFSGIGQAAQSYVANRILEKRNNASIAVDEAKANQINIENKYKAADLASSIWQKIENTRNERQKRFYQEMLNNTFEQQFSTDMREKEANIQVLESAVREKNVDIALKEFQLHNIPQQFQMQLAAMSADILLKKAQTKMTNAQARTELQKMYKTFFETKGIKINNSILERSADSIVNKAHTEQWHTSPIGILSEFLGTN